MVLECLQRLIDLIKRQTHGEEVDWESLCEMYIDTHFQVRHLYDNLRKKALSGNDFSDDDTEAFNTLTESVKVLDSNWVRKWQHLNFADPGFSAETVTREDVSCLAEIVPELSASGTDSSRMPIRLALVLLPGLATAITAVLAVSFIVGNGDDGEKSPPLAMAIVEPGELPAGDEPPFPAGKEEMSAEPDTRAPLSSSQSPDETAHVGAQPRPSQPTEQTENSRHWEQESEDRSQVLDENRPTPPPPSRHGIPPDHPPTPSDQPSPGSEQPDDAVEDIQTPASPEQLRDMIKRGKYLVWGMEQNGKTVVVEAKRLMPFLSRNGSSGSLRNYHPGLYNERLGAIFLAKDHEASSATTDMYSGNGLSVSVQDALMVVNPLAEDAQRPSFILLRQFEAPDSEAVLLWTGEIQRRVSPRSSVMANIPEIQLDRTGRSTGFNLALSELRLTRALHAATPASRTNQSAVASFFCNDKVSWDALCKVTAVDSQGNPVGSSQTCIIPLEMRGEVRRNYLLTLVIDHNKIPSDIFDSRARPAPIDNSAIIAYAEELRRGLIRSSSDVPENLQRATASWLIAKARIEEIGKILQEWKLFKAINDKLEQTPNSRWRRNDVSGDLSQYETLSFGIGRTSRYFTIGDKREGKFQESQLLPQSHHFLNGAYDRLSKLDFSPGRNYWQQKRLYHQANSSYSRRHYSTARSEQRQFIAQAEQAFATLEACYRSYQSDFEKKQRLLHKSLQENGILFTPVKIRIAKIRCRSKLTENTLLLWEMN